tara:strand:- start:10966 stop:11310 length:345 start_codon:yes stop_codon:yes gene_type:complete
MQSFVEFTTEKDLLSYSQEVKKNNVSVIGTASESPLEVGDYQGTIQGNMSRIVGKSNGNEWCIFLTEVKVKGGTFAGVMDRIPFNPSTMLKKNTIVSFNIYLDKNNLKRGKLIV